MSSIPTMLTYEKSVAPSPGLMYAKTYDNQKVPLEVHQLHGRGAQSTYTAGHGEKDTDLGEWMPLRQDICQLPHNASDLVIEFSLKYLPKSLTPHSCNKADWIVLLEEMAQLYAKKGGYLYQAYCQMDALFQGLPFWRNNDGESMTLQIINISDKILPHYQFTGLPCSGGDLTATNKNQFDGLIKNIEQALRGVRSVLRLRVIASLEKGMLEEVHPSEQFIEKIPEGKKAHLHRLGKYQKTRHYAFYQLGAIRQAMLHNTKIGAGLRPDRWNQAEKEIPLSVYGLDGKEHQAIRGRGTNQDFYSLIKNIEEYITLLHQFEGTMLSDTSVRDMADIHFIMGNLLKGGVFNKESTKSKKKNTSEDDPIDLSNP